MVDEMTRKAELLLKKCREAAVAGDNEAAHSAEDELRLHALECVDKLGSCAATEWIVRLALMSRAIPFERWSA